MSAIRNLANNRPFVFVVALFVVNLAIALPFVAIFRIGGFDIAPLRLIIPIADSAFSVWVVWYLGWFRRAGFIRQVSDIHLYWYPAALAFVPVFVYGTVQVPPGPILFYTAALLFTGISEETLARGIMLPALSSRGKWVALFAAAAIFSAGHITNLFFESFGLLEWTDKFLATFGFAVLYGAVFLRTGNIWPLIFLHMLHDYSYVTSGSAGPFTVTPFDIRLHLLLSVLNIAYAVLIMQGASLGNLEERLGPAAGVRGNRL
jgi:membrane protease YdiL (CAAX protease family)